MLLERPDRDKERTVTMNVSISAWHDSGTCTWCQKEAEGVTASFDSGFLCNAQLCWKCLQQAVRVHASQETAGKPGLSTTVNDG
jgi:hypothetical protein